jgi:carbamoyltransferase
MLICGINLTHDGGIAVIDGNRLLFSAESEKLGLGRRYSSLLDLNSVAQILDTEGLGLTDIDRFVVNGWYSKDGEAFPTIHAVENGQRLNIPVAPYIDQGASKGILFRHTFTSAGRGPLASGYASYVHVAGHVLGAYCASPFASKGEEALVLAWDGGMLPRLYRVDPRSPNVEFLGPLFPLIGDVFVQFCLELEPFRSEASAEGSAEESHVGLEVPGKAMAYAALGSAEPNVFPALQAAMYELTMGSFDAATGKTLAVRMRELFPNMSSADLIATYQACIGERIVESLTRLVHRRFKGRRIGLCLSGGCALNIKWNSKIRASGAFTEIYVPPFPNDSGAAIGAACCEMVSSKIAASLEWDVYSGPQLGAVGIHPDWSARPCDETQVASVLHREGEPVVVLHGRAELGPRALGNRSILAPALQATMTNRLNVMKGRAHYRPVAPLCLESRAKEIFDPGTQDPYMLFEHRVRANWARRLPAIVHLDGSARLQTITPSTSNTVAGRILEEYERLSGIPVLCNTSANLSGHGFFQDVLSAMTWGRTRYVWSEGVLYTKLGAGGSTQH